MKYTCSNCELELNIKKQGVYLCPICDSNLYDAQFSDEDKEKSVKEYSEKIDKNKINEILDNEDSIKNKVTKSGNYGVLKYVEAFFKLIKDPKALIKHKVLAAAALLYVFNPIDVVPDVLVGVGLLDDGAVLLYTFKLMSDAVKKYMGMENIKDTIGHVKPNFKERKNNDKVILYKFVEDDKAIKYNYEEKKEQVILILNRIDINRLNFNIINDELIMINEYYTGHPYFRKTLIKYNNYDSIIMEDIFQERIKILRAIGAKEVTCNIIDVNIETKDENIDIGLIEKIANGEINRNKKSISKKNYSIREKYGNSCSFDDSIIDNLVWFFTKEGSFKDIFRSRIMNCLESIKLSTTDRSDEVAPIVAKVNIPTNFNIMFTSNKRKFLYKTVEFNVDFYELPVNIKNDPKKFLEIIENRLNERRIELKTGGETIGY